jgi:O-acetylhomoserine (thiol)-lyase
MTSTYAFANVAESEQVMAEERDGYLYGRERNPTQALLEARLAELEGAEACVVTASGMAAIGSLFLSLLSQGDELVIHPTVYSNTVSVTGNALPRFGVRVVKADMRDLDALAAAIGPRTRLVYMETPINPTAEVLDIAAVARVVHARGARLVVDSTFASPAVQRPIEHGADIVVHSLTKYLGGHGNSIGGAIVDSGKFPWGEHAQRFRRLNEPDVSYHGVNYVEALGPAAYIARARVVPLRNMGAPLSPLNSFLLLQGIETLAVRMDRINANTLAVARYLADHAAVAWVRYAGLPSDVHHGLAQRYLDGHGSGILSFGIDGGSEAGARFIDALQLITRLVNIGDAKSLACHPASTTHRQLTPAELIKAGVSADLVRLSIGIEHIDDIIADIEQALRAATAKPRLVGSA